MTLHPSQEIARWQEFMDHTQSCPTCSQTSPRVLPLCPTGNALYLAWARTDAVAARAEQEADDASDCADDGEFLGEAQRETYD